QCSSRERSRPKPPRRWCHWVNTRCAASPHPAPSSPSRMRERPVSQGVVSDRASCQALFGVPVLLLAAGAARRSSPAIGRQPSRLLPFFITSNFGFDPERSLPHQPPRSERQELPETVGKRVG